MKSNQTFQTALISATFLLLTIFQVVALPNLTPYQPSGWSDKIVVSRTANSTTDSTSLTTADTLYVNAAVINNGTTATDVNFQNAVFVDGVEVTYWVTAAPLNVDYYSYLTTGYSIGQLSAGTHTITVIADYGGVITESNESDNSYTKTITVSSPGQPNLTPYQPSGWSDKIIVARTASSTTDSTSLTTADTLYVNAAVINNGTAATAVNFNNEVYVDGVPTFNWVTVAPLNVNSYSYLTTGYSIGQLSAGTHTIEVVADYGGAISESNEGDNFYTKTITVSNPPQPNLTPYQPSGWSDKIVVTRTAGSTTDSTSLTTADPLYIDWAVINNGNATATGTFYTYLYVDGVYQTDWSTVSLTVDNYAYVTNYFLGSLTAGTHTIEIVADATGAIAESNEGDNSYTKTITVSLANLPAPTLNNPANGSTGQSTTPTFSWSPITGASSYRIIVATSAADLPSDPTATTGGPSVVTNATPTTASFTPSIPLSAGTTYYWEVHARSATQYGTWSSVNSFTTSPLVNSLTIIPIFDSSITSDPQAATIEATINSAIAVYKNDFSDPVTVSIEFQETTSAFILGASSKPSITVPYSDYIAALISHATTTDDATALTHLPTGTANPVNGNQNVDLNYALARALGFSADIPSVQPQTMAGLKISIVNPSGVDTASSDSILAALKLQTTGSINSDANPLDEQPDGTILLNTTNMNLSAAQTDPTKYSLFSVVSHEIDEVLGFGSALNGLNNGDAAPTGPIMPEDLFRYDQNGARSFTTDVNAASYFSIDGTTDIARFNQYQGGDFGDWYSYYGGQIPQVQDAYSTPGAAPVLGVELRCLDVIGFTRISSPVTINASAGSGGTINPNGSFSKNTGDNQLFTATPNADYVVDQWLVDGSVVQNGGTSYTLYNIQGGHSVQVTFTQASSPMISNPKLTGTTFTLSVPTQIGFNYILEYKNSLTDANWTPVQTIGGTGGMITLTDTTATGSSRFYHIRVQ